MTDKPPTRAEVEEVVKKALAKAKEEIDDYIDKSVPADAAEAIRAQIINPFVEKVAARIAEKFAPEILSALAGKIVETFKAGKGPSRKNPVALA